MDRMKQFETFSKNISSTFMWVSRCVTFQDNKLSLSINHLTSQCIHNPQF